MSIDNPKFCPYCGAEKISRFAHREDNKEPVYACFSCRRAFSILLLKEHAVTGGKN